MELTPEEVRLVEKDRAQNALRAGGGTQSGILGAMRAWVEHNLRDLKSEIKTLPNINMPDDTMAKILILIDRRIRALHHVNQG